VIFRRIRKWGHTVERAQRFRAIVAVFLKYGYEDLADRLPLPNPMRLPFRKMRQTQEEVSLLAGPERLRRAFEELGPTFIKLGQLLSTRRHLLPPAFTHELAKLHDEVPPIPFDQILDVLARELKRPTSELFISIDEAPVGSASIAQVHRAILMTGDQVVVKVQRPGIEPLVRLDLEIMAQLAALLEKHVETWRVHRPTAIVAEFARRMEQELDFAAEAAHVERFSHQFAQEPTIYVPKVFHEVSTQHVLTLEHVEAIKASRFDELDAAGLDRREIASRIVDLVMKQVFVFGFFHADPHPGNIHILPENVICFLDFGMMGYLDQKTRETFGRFIEGIAQRDERLAAGALLRLANAELDPPRPGFEADLAEFMHQHFYRPMGEMMFGKLVNHLFALTARHNLTMPADLFTMLKALSLTESLVTRLDPGHDILGQARPFMKEVRMRQVRPQRLWRYWMEFGGDVTTLLRELPIEARRILSQIKEGRAKLMVHHGGFEDLLSTLERIVNRLSFTLVLSSLIISSSVIVHARVPPLWHDVSVIGIVGYLVAGVMGFWLLISMLRHGKM